MRQEVVVAGIAIVMSFLSILGPGAIALASGSTATVVPTEVRIGGSFLVKHPASGNRVPVFTVFDPLTGDVPLKRAEMTRDGDEYRAEVWVVRTCDDCTGKKYCIKVRESTKKLIIYVFPSKNSSDYDDHEVTIKYEREPVKGKLDLSLILNDGEVQTLSDGVDLKIQITDGGRDNRCEKEKVPVKLALGSKSWEVKASETADGSGIFTCELPVKFEHEGASLRVRIGNKEISSEDLGASGEQQPFLVVSYTSSNGEEISDKRPLAVYNLTNCLPHYEALNPRCFSWEHINFGPNFERVEGGYARNETDKDFKVSYVLKEKDGVSWGFAYKEYQKKETYIIIKDGKGQELAQLTCDNRTASISNISPQASLSVELYTWIPPDKVQSAPLQVSYQFKGSEFCKQDVSWIKGKDSVYRVDIPVKPCSKIPPNDALYAILMLTWFNPDCPLEQFSIQIDIKRQAEPKGKGSGQK